MYKTAPTTLCFSRYFKSPFNNIVRYIPYKYKLTQNTIKHRYRNNVHTVADGFHFTAQGNTATPPRCAIMRVLFLVVNNAETDDVM